MSETIKISDAAVAVIDTHAKLLSRISAEESKTSAQRCKRYQRLILEFVAPNAETLTHRNGQFANHVLSYLLQRFPGLNRTTISSAWSAYRADVDKFRACETIEQIQNIDGDGDGDSDAEKKSPRDAALSAIENALKRCKSAGVERTTIEALLSLRYGTASPQTIETAEPKAPEPKAQSPEPKAPKARKARSAPAQDAIGTPAQSPEPAVKAG